MDRRWVLLAVLAAPLWLPTAADASYGHIQRVEGSADLLPGAVPPAVEATANYPIQVGDQLLVSPGGRLEAVLPDGTRLRLDGNTAVRLTRLASPDTQDDNNDLAVTQGQIQLSLIVDPVGPQAFRIDTANASLFPQSSGSYRIFTDGKSWTQVIVRDGFVNVLTERGETRLTPGQQAIIDGQRSPKVTVEAAPGPDAFEQWADSNEAAGRSIAAQVPYRRGTLAPRLSYAATSLHRHGRWMQYRGSQVWRPHAPIDWRPYHSGWWIYTSAGLTWVSTEPWGWVPYHYGVWGYAGGIGWVWHPGDRYTPGAVYWYWGPSHVGWIPAGYYPPTFGPPYCALPPYGYFWGSHHDRYVNPLGVYGHRGGAIANWRDWTFSSYDRFGYRDNHRYLKTGAELQTHGVLKDTLPPGVVTTRTGALTPNLWQEPERAQAALTGSRPARSRRHRLSPLGEAALSGFPGLTTPTGTRPPATSSRSSDRLVRQWDPTLWRREQSSATLPVVPYRRDTRGSTTGKSGYRSPTLRDRRWSRLPARGSAARPGGTGYRRPGAGLPAPGRSSIGGTRSSPRSPSAGTVRGRSPGRGRSTIGAPGRMSGSGSSGRSTRGGASRSAAGDGGSG